jgi:methionyl-tRNA formyltransferase
MRVVFCGTPQFAVPSLQALLAAGHEVPLVLAQPDRPVGRKQVLTPPAVKQAALAAGLSVAQPEKIRNNAELEAQLREVAPDVIVVVAYGRIIPPWMLHLPRFGNVNVHGSLLPKYRGAAPIQWALANGETETGVTTMLLDEGLDTGPMLGRTVLPIGEEETAVDLTPRMAAAGAALLMKTLEDLATGTANPVPQDSLQATLAPILSREDGRVDFSRNAQQIYNRWRGFQPWPGAFAQFRGEKLALLQLRMNNLQSDAPPGTLEVRDERLLFSCGDHFQLEIVEAQPAGKRAMSAAELLRGLRLQAGERLE